MYVKIPTSQNSAPSMRNMLAVFVFFFVVAGVLPCSMAAEGTSPELTADDCAKCHDAAPKAIEENGMAHKTSVTCTDCHVGHPPKDLDIIPQCSMCHSGESHFELEGCLNCHTNPHTPLEITLGDEVTDPCLTCHTDQIEQLRNNPSMHTEQFCTTCHTVHGEIPDCTTCHDPHSAQMVQSDCVTCHQAHMPLQVTYPDDIDSKMCAACHDVAYNLLISNPAKHSELACAYCHKEKHKMIPKCQDCHGVPHPDAMMQKFTTCGECHNIAHDLNK